MYARNTRKQQAIAALVAVVACAILPANMNPAAWVRRFIPGV